MPSFCSLLLPLVYSNNFAGKIDASLFTGYKDELEQYAAQWNSVKVLPTIDYHS